MYTLMFTIQSPDDTGTELHAGPIFRPESTHENRDPARCSIHNFRTDRPDPTRSLSIKGKNHKTGNEFNM